MKLFGDSNIIHDSVKWIAPLRLRVTIREPVRGEIGEARQEPAEFDENGRRYVFRYRPAEHQTYTIDRERIFEYVKQRRLPGPAARAYARDIRNSVNFFEDVRDLQTHSDVEILHASP
jgi:hypothetical protein